VPQSKPRDRKQEAQRGATAQGVLLQLLPRPPLLLPRHPPAPAPALQHCHSCCPQTTQTHCKGQWEAPSSQRVPVALTCCQCCCCCPALLLLHCRSRPQRRAARAAGRYNKEATKPKHDEPPASLIARSPSENDTTISNTMGPAETARTAAPPALPGLQKNKQNVRHQFTPAMPAHRPESTHRLGQDRWTSSVGVEPFYAMLRALRELISEHGEEEEECVTGAKQAATLQRNPVSSCRNRPFAGHR
jgi:hypothetical protein